MLGAFLALIAAFSFGLNNASVRRGVLSGNAFQATLINIGLGVLMFAGAAVATGQIGRVGELSQKQLLVFAAAGIVHFVIGRYANYGAIQAMGANLAGAVVQMQVLVALVVDRKSVV